MRSVMAWLRHLLSKKQSGHACDLVRDARQSRSFDSWLRIYRERLDSDPGRRQGS